MPDSCSIRSVYTRHSSSVHMCPRAGALFSMNFLNFAQQWHKVTALVSKGSASMEVAVHTAIQGVTYKKTMTAFWTR